MHLELHSFPTRRSSDLMSGVIDIAVWILEFRYERDCTICAYTPSATLFTNTRSLTKSRLACTHRSCSRARDRKSTRLNSSHPSISYAVFCLKKKTPRSL